MRPPKGSHVKGSRPLLLIFMACPFYLQKFMQVSPLILTCPACISLIQTPTYSCLLFHTCCYQLIALQFEVQKFVMVAKPVNNKSMRRLIYKESLELSLFDQI